MAETLRCSVCGSPLYVLSSKLTSEVGSTDVYSEIKMGCKNDRYPGNNNEPCIRYAGGENPNPDLIKPVKNKVN